jgi:hypothetical protein
MKFQTLFDTAVKLGMAADPRSAKELKVILDKRKKAYDKMDKDEQQYVDQSLFTNPYEDSRVLHAESMDDDIKLVLAGIDLEHGELLLAHELKKMGKKVDLVMAHHPEGPALLGLGDVMHLQDSIMNACGVPINVAEKIMSPRKNEIKRGVHPTNFIRGMHTAQLLGINYACTHTITDNMAYDYLNKKVCKGKAYHTVGDVVDRLMKEPEYQMASKLGNPPIIVCGSKESRAGRVVPSEITGGTSGNEAIYERLSNVGVGTVIAMHMSEKHRKEAEKHHLNVIVAGHMASDSLGMNLLLDEFEKKKVKVIVCGMFRSKRK